MAANPAFRNARATERLEEAKFPLSLPPGLPLLETRLFLNHLQVPRERLIRLLAPRDADGWANEFLAVHVTAPYKDALVVEALAWTPGTNGTVKTKAFNLVTPEGPLADPAAGPDAAGRGGRGPARFGPTDAELTAYLGERNIGIFSIDADSFDFKLKNPDRVIASVMTKLDKQGNGIVLLHDFQHSTAVALPALLLQLKAKGFKIVHLKAKDPVKSLPQYEAAMVKTRTGQTVDGRPTSSVVRTIQEPPQ